MARGTHAATRLAWQERLRRFREAGSVSVAEFCRQERVSVPSFYGWRKKLAQDQAMVPRQGPSSASRPAAKSVGTQSFLPLRVSGSSTAATEALEICLPNGAQLRLPASWGTSGWLPSLVAAAGLAPPADARREKPVC